MADEFDRMNKVIRDSIGCIKLWRAVMHQAFTDATTNSAMGENKNKRKIVKQQSINWLLKQDSDFHQICSMANLDPEKIQSKINDLFNTAKAA